MAESQISDMGCQPRKRERYSSLRVMEIAGVEKLAIFFAMSCLIGLQITRVSER